MYVQSNGFAGHSAWLGDDKELESYTFWSRFTVKQTYDELRPKRTFAPHVSNHKTRTGDWNADTAVHGPQSMQHGWEWYEMGFITCWNASGHLTLLCFDVPAKSQPVVQSVFCSQSVDTTCPYAVFAVVSDELLRLYDNSVWSIRNHISQWEARRSQETDYVLLHEIARHGVHVSETLIVAVRSLGAIRQHHDKFTTEKHLVSGNRKRRSWNAVGDDLEFQLRFLEGLMERSQANNARIQNEITLEYRKRD
ncbi:hypothetical protein SLS59_007084 [Nothophoma quercina]|uniref:Uncharacterized protein n=1 Tax=Nothophoma quercina TaxID=749835 RepID=A0ABR3R0Z5_9PLEO